ncbi:MAG: GAF domain-containing protein [Candidatus Dormibacteria bacterium]
MSENDWTALSDLSPGPGALAAAARVIRAAAPHYTGVYLYGVEGDELVLRAHAGRDTDHVRIPVGQGVCGAAVALGEDQLVADVTADPRYIACSIETRSEVVVLARHAGRIVGQIDIDSDVPAAFTDLDLHSLEQAARLIAPLFDQ